MVLPSKCIKNVVLSTLCETEYGFYTLNYFQILFTILGAYSTFKLGKLLYSYTIGKLAALLFYSCFSIIMINQDVRTDTILIGITVFSEFIFLMNKFIES
mgnify:CR=1 FL=1